MNGHDMIRFKQKLNDEECREILNSASHGVLSLVDSDLCAYGVPPNFVYDGENIYFHCAKRGFKNDCINNNKNASFCVVSKDDIVPDELTSYFKSVIVSGEIKIETDESRKLYALDILCKKYTGSSLPENGINSASKCVLRAEILTLSPSDITGKQAKELIK